MFDLKKTDLLRPHSGLRQHKLRPEIMEPLSSIWALNLTSASSNYVDCNNPDSLKFGSGDFSICAWINVATWTNAGGIFGAGTANDADPGYVVRLVNPDKIQLLIGNGTARKVVTVAGFVVDTWYRVLMVVDRSADMILYVNGVNVGSIDISSFSGSTDKDANKLIGSQSDFFDGRVADVCAYERVLSADEVQRDFDRGLNTKQLDKRDLVGYWRFQEGFGVTDGTGIRDWSGQENHGGMQNFSGEPWVNIGVSG